MPKIKYKEIKFQRGTLALIDKCNAIIADYTNQGYRLTLRQLYYQLVARAIIANKQTEYDRVGGIINDARLAGLIDWMAIEDRTRNLRGLQHWDSPQQIVDAAHRGYRMDMWANQRHRVEVWIEKDALIGVIDGVCSEFDVPCFSCRGYTSQSEMWGAGQRLRAYAAAGQLPTILHFGDHDPSGIDMTRDINDRLEMFMGGIPVQRLALNMDQVRHYKPPPNPAKTTDSRYKTYIKEYGEESWELDALEPKVISNLIRSTLTRIIDRESWDARLAVVEQGRKKIAKALKYIKRSK
jgi:hypothetical protein